MVRFLILGRFTIETIDALFDERDLPGPQGRLMLAALLVERRALLRDELADIIWEDDLPAEWNAGLSAVTSKLRSLLDRIGLGRDCLISSGGALELALPGDCWVDLEDAITRLDRALGLARRNEVRNAREEATVASAILHRPFLPGLDRAWADSVRRDLSTRLLTCLDLLAELWLDDDPRLARSIAEQALDLNPFAEPSYRVAMQASHRLGEGAEAAAILLRCETVLSEEFGIAPSPETISAAEAYSPVRGSDISSESP